MSAVEVDTLPAVDETACPVAPCADAPGWIARHGSTVDFLLAAELTFASALDEAAEAPDEGTEATLTTARQRMLDAAAIVAAADAVPDATAAHLLRSALTGVEAFGEDDDDVVGHISVARRILAVEEDLGAAIRRLRQLGAGTVAQSVRLNSAA